MNGAPSCRVPVGRAPRASVSGKVGVGLQRKSSLLPTPNVFFGTLGEDTWFGSIGYEPVTLPHTAKHAEVLPQALPKVVKRVCSMRLSVCDRWWVCKDSNLGPAD